jgi:hypothetical protein
LAAYERAVGLVGSDKGQGGNPVKLLPLLDSKEKVHKDRSPLWAAEAEAEVLSAAKVIGVVVGVFDAASSSSCAFPSFVAGSDDQSAGELHYFRPKKTGQSLDEECDEEESPTVVFPPTDSAGLSSVELPTDVLRRFRLTEGSLGVISPSTSLTASSFIDSHDSLSPDFGSSTGGSSLGRGLGAFKFGPCAGTSENCCVPCRGNGPLIVTGLTGGGGVSLFNLLPPGGVDSRFNGGGGGRTLLLTFLGGGGGGGGPYRELIALLLRIPGGGGARR